MKSLLIACALMVLAVAAAAGDGDKNNPNNSNDSDYAPAETFIGTHDGDLLRCSQEDNGACVVWHKANSRIMALLISGEYIYLGLISGDIFRCHLLINPCECETFYSGRIMVRSLSIGKGIFAALADGTIMRCDLYKPCQPLHQMGIQLTSSIQIDDEMYAGIGNGQLMRCSLIVANQCVKEYEADAGITGLARLGNNLYVLSYLGQLVKCSLRSGGQIAGCVSINSEVTTSFARELKSFAGSLYVADEHGSGIYKWMNNASYERVIEIYQPWSVDMAYGTYPLQEQYKNEHVSCKLQSGAEACLQVIYYHGHERTQFEVYVKDGRLYNSTNSLVDTSDADLGRLGPAAIFSMGRDGKIYLSNFRLGGRAPILGSIHTSSFLAGHPVSGAGEIIVENGVVRKILACSSRYKTDLKSNEQVIKSLLTQGYTDSIVSEVCPQGNERDQS